MKKISLLLCCLLMTFTAGCEEKNAVSTSTATVTEKKVMWGDFPNEKPSCIKGIHLTSWYVGSSKGRAKFEALLAETELNTVVIDIKETEGDVYVPGIKLAGQDVFVNAMPNIREYLKFLKERGVYTIARLVVFKDSMLVKKRPEWAIQSSSPLPKAAEKKFQKDVWVDYKGNAWADPYNTHVWDYNIDIAEKAVELGFQEVQFDYIRFPSDGNLKLCVYSKPHNAGTAVKALAGFLERAHKRLKAKGAEISIDVFGLTSSTKNDMGIGQQMSELLKHIDAISPMMYPSHYAKGEYGIPDPDKAPYETLYRGIKDLLVKIKGTHVKARPYLQDFSLGTKYTGEMVREQIRAANDLGIDEWLLWNASCRYTKEALLPFASKKSKEPVVETDAKK